MERTTTTAPLPYVASAVELLSLLLFVLGWMAAFTIDLDSVLPGPAVASSDVTDTAAP